MWYKQSKINQVKEQAVHWGTVILLAGEDPLPLPVRGWGDEKWTLKVEACNKLGGSNCLRCLTAGHKCAQLPVQKRSQLQPAVSGIKPFCMEMTVQAQEGGRAHSTDRHRMDNKSVMLKKAPAPFEKTLQRMENLCDCFWEQAKKHCLGVQHKGQSVSGQLS